VNTIFVDTFYWLARIDTRDQGHRRAREISDSLADTLLLTTAAVLIELLNYFSAYGPEMRQAAAHIVRHILGNQRIEVLPQPHESFLAGLALSEARPDKGYSLTDCLSMQAMRDRGLTDVLTHDRHFAQEGFVILL
jgi:predicted nucleic acid-binding protein